MSENIDLTSLDFLENTGSPIAVMTLGGTRKNFRDGAPLSTLSNVQGKDRTSSGAGFRLIVL
jgi:hypothetical protein